MLLGTLKFLHIYGLMLGAAGSLGNLGVTLRLKQHEGAPPPIVLSLRPFFSKLGLAGILLLWVTGLMLYFDEFAGRALGTAFVAKLVVAFLLLAASAALNIMGARAAKTGTAPPAIMQRIGQSTSVLAPLAVALAIYVFG